MLIFEPLSKAAGVHHNMSHVLDVSGGDAGFRKVKVVGNREGLARPEGCVGGLVQLHCLIANATAHNGKVKLRCCDFGAIERHLL